MTRKKSAPQKRGTKLKSSDKIRLAYAESLIRSDERVAKALRLACKKYRNDLPRPLSDKELNRQVDRLLKKEFDVHRAKGTPHELMMLYKVDAVPFQHPKIDEWRENFKGVQFLHPPTNLLVTGAIDDLWVNPQGQVIVVDYKATAKKEDVTIDADWQMAYKRQMEMYQWLVRKKGLTVSDTGYFVYCNGRDAEAFNGHIDFAIKVLPYTGADTWVEDALVALKRCLMSENIPPPADECEFCGYAQARAASETA